MSNRYLFSFRLAAVCAVLFCFLVSRAEQPALPSNIVAGGDSTGVFSRAAKLGEDILDFVTWKNQGVVFTVYPALGANSRSGFVYGVMPAIKWNSARKGKVNTVTINAEASTKGMKQLQVEHEWYFYELLMTSGKIMFDSREDQYWMDSGVDGFFFERREARFNLDLLYNAAPSLWLGVEALVSCNRFPDRGPYVYSGGELAGTGGGWLAGFAPKVVLDTRERTLAPQSGVWLQLTPLLAGVGGVGDYRYNKITFDFRQYVQLKEGKSTLAFQGLLDYADEEVPFYEAPRLGGKERLRGIGHPLRETGNAVWMARAELRQFIWWRFGGVVFAGVGQAAPDYQSPFSNSVASVGGGVRFRMLPDDPLNVRFDFGVSSMGTTGFFVSLKEAF